ncbi:MAG: hypothetical protein WDA09_07220 [Bacteriovoracaceae bacterium]
MIEFYLPFLFQGIFMLADEFHFHQKRGLPRWERIGHPLDTLTTLVTLSIPAFFPLDSFYLQVYISLSIFSCIFITKDEFVHNDHCSKTEHWLHAILFILHPLTFIAAYFLWRNHAGITFLKFQFTLVFCFMFYQIFKWSLPWKRVRK